MAKASGPRAEAYRDAAAERSQDAVELFLAGRCGAAIWVAGVALECLFRAYHRRRSEQLDTGHDLKSLYKASRFADRVSPRHVERMGSSIGLVAASWKNRYRYDPEDAVRRSIGIRNATEFQRRAREVVNAVQEIVNHGVKRWPSDH